MKYRMLILLLLCACVPAFAMPTRAAAERLFKTLVAVKFIYEEGGEASVQEIVGSVWSGDGLVIVSPNSLPWYMRAENIKDMKVFFRGCGGDGVPAEFVGTDIISKFSLVKIRGGLPKGLLPLSEVKRGTAGFGSRVFSFDYSGIETNMHMFYKESYVSALLPGFFNSIVLCRGICKPGAAAFNAEGEFVGIGDDGGSIGEPFAVDFESDKIMVQIRPLLSQIFLSPADADAIVKRVLADPKLEKSGWIGVGNLSVVKRATAKTMGIGNSPAIIASDVIKNSPADKAGLKSGAIIVEVNGKPLPSLDYPSHILQSFKAAIQSLPVGGGVDLGVFDGGQITRVKIAAAKCPRLFNQTASKFFKKLGFTLRELMIDDLFAHRILDAAAEGAIVEFVKPNGPADGDENSSLSAGDLILEINSRPVSTYKQAVEMLEAAQKADGEITLLVSEINRTKLVRIKADK